MAAFAFLSPLLFGFALGALACWLALRAQARRAANCAQECSALQATLNAIKTILAKAEVENVTANEHIQALGRENATVTAQLFAERESLARERAGFEKQIADVKLVFENSANQMLGQASATLKRDSGEFMAQKQQAIDTLLQPIRESLGKLEQQSQQLEVKRENAYAGIEQQIKAMQESHLGLRQETRQLVGALRNPKVRGNWGEMQLRRCIEFAGMLERCDFIPQPSTRTSDGDLLRPDVRVMLPNKRCVIIDAKTPLDAFLSAMNCPDTAEGDAERKRLLQQHAAQLREHLKQLDRKGYAREFAREGSPELVVCFLPSEVLLSSALEQDAALIEFSSTVVLATPTTLIALLKAIQCGWQQMAIARDTEQIREAALGVYQKLATATDSIGGMGNALKRAVNEYNGFLRTVQGRGGIFSQGRKLHDLAIGREELDSLSQLEATPDLLTHDDWIPQPRNSELALAAAEE